MNLRRLTARVAVAGVTTALGAATLVGTTTVAANAVENTTSYTCTALGNPAGTFAMKVSTPVMPASANSGAAFPAGLLVMDAEVTAPNAVLGLVSGLNGGKIKDYAAKVGTTTIAAPLTFGAPEDNGNGSSTLRGTGSNSAFALPKAGTYSVQLPGSFTFTPTTASGEFPVTVACTSATPGDFGKIRIDANPTALKGKAVKTAKGYALTVKAAAADPNTKLTPTGKVTAKVGAKKYVGTLKKGTARIKLPKSAKGKTVKISYASDGYMKAATTVLKIKK